MSSGFSNFMIFTTKRRLQCFRERNFSHLSNGRNSDTAGGDKQAQAKNDSRVDDRRSRKGATTKNTTDKGKEKSRGRHNGVFFTRGHGSKIEIFIDPS